MKKYSGISFERVITLMICLLIGQIQSQSGDCDAQASILSQLKGGEGFLQFGNWRIGAYNKFQFKFSHRMGQTPVTYKSDGATYPKGQKNLWQKRGGTVSKIKLLQKCIQFDSVWRLCEIDNSHLSLSCLTFKTSGLWRVDGKHQVGPRQDFNGFVKNLSGINVKFGERFVELGYWRIGENDTGGLSIGTQTLVAHILRMDGDHKIGADITNRIERPVAKSYDVK